jgi:dTDP-4-amino-4,6-dideoxygalactose transaminase
MRYSEQTITAEDEAAVLEALRSGYLTQGTAVEVFESKLSEYVGSKYAVAVSSGTAALHLSYVAAGARCVATSPLSFVATANAAIMAGAAVAFIDVDRATALMDVHPGSMFPDKTVVVPVHFAGRAAVVPERLDTFEGCTDPVVIEDACHALGAMDHDGCSKVGSCSHSLACVFSFHPVKPLTTGEGGAVTTNDEGFAQEIRALRSHGRDERGLMQKLGWNYRMDEMSAALGASQFSRIEDRKWKRARVAELYRLMIPELPSVDQIGSAYHLYPVRIGTHPSYSINDRDLVKGQMNDRGFGVQVHYSPPIHLQPYYRARFGYTPGKFPEAEAWAREELSLPLHANMTSDDVAAVVRALEEALS